MPVLLQLVTVMLVAMEVVPVLVVLVVVPVALREVALVLVLVVDGAALLLLPAHPPRLRA